MGSMTQTPFERPQLLSGQEPALHGVRLIATDVDGTLTVAGRLPAETLRSLQDLRQAGLKVLLITGRSAGWVQGLSAYLPVDGAIAENGGVLLRREPESIRLLCSVTDLEVHRQTLAGVFAQIQQALPRFPDLKVAGDNRFRLTDWTFDQQGFTVADLDRMAQICHGHQQGFTYSSVQCHIKPLDCDKGLSLLRVLEEESDLQCSLHQVLTVGDSPNDQSLFDPARFPFSVGVANVWHYRDQLKHLPTYVTAAEEGTGFQQLTQILLAARTMS